MLVDTKIKKPTHSLIVLVALLTPFLFRILLVVEVKSFYILKFSLTVSDKKMLWILVQKEPLEILTSWCSFMAGTSQSCNYVIAVYTLYKIDYALQKSYLNPSCTLTSSSWNKSTKHDIELKKTLLFERKLDQGQTLKS